MISHRHLVAALLALPLVAAALPAVAQQDYDRPPPGFGENRGGYGNGADQGYDNGDRGDRGDRNDRGDAAPVDRPDPAGLAVRVGRLEGRIRDMTGQIEELQNANRRLVEQLQKFQADVDDRLSSAAGHNKRSDASPPAAERPVASSADHAADSAPAKPHRGRDEAFDPDTASPKDPGRPKPLGSVASAQPDDTGSAPLDLAGGRLRKSGGGASDADTIAPTLRLPPRVSSTPDAPPADRSVVATATPSTPREAYDAALGLFRDKQYDEAEKGFAAFIDKNPKSRLAADATYYLGESYAQRGRSREAAEQYLKVSTEFSSSTRAPDAMLHLGMSLKSLGAKEQACATFAEVTRKYPNAPAYVKSGAERELKRAQCG